MGCRRAARHLVLDAVDQRLLADQRGADHGPGAQHPDARAQRLHRNARARAKRERRTEHADRAGAGDRGPCAEFAQAGLAVDLVGDRVGGDAHAEPDRDGCERGDALLPARARQQRLAERRDPADRAHREAGLQLASCCSRPVSVPVVVGVAAAATTDVSRCSSSSPASPARCACRSRACALA